MANTAINHDPAATFPGSSTDIAVVKWSGTGGKTLANSGVTIDASNNVTVPGNITTTGYIHLTGDTKELRFYENGNFIAIKAPSLGADYTLTLPINDGSADEFLQTNGSGVLTWASAAIADDSIVEGKLNVSNGPSNGYVLTARDGVAGGFTWEAAAAGGANTSLSNLSSPSVNTTINMNNNGINNIGASGNDIIAAGYAAVDGTAGAPSHTFVNNTNTGMFRDAPHNVAFSTNGTTRLRIAGAGGLITIGDASTNGSMTIGLTIQQGTNDNEGFCVKSNSDINHGISGADTDSYFTIRKSNPGHGGAMLTGYIEGGDYAGIQLRTYVIDANGTKSSSGAGSFNLTAYHGTDGGPLNDSANANIAVFRAGNTHTRFIFDVEGDGFADGSWTTYSDGRLKFNQEVIPYGLDALMQLQPKVYEKDSGYLEDGVPVLEGKRNRQIGFVAQEVKAIIPEVVKDIDDDSWYSLEDGKLMAVVVKAIQELNDKVDAL